MIQRIQLLRPRSVAGSSLINILVFCIALTSASITHASTIDVSISPPSFNFQIDNNLLPQHQSKLSPDEYDLSVKLKPLLEKENYAQALTLLQGNTSDNKSVALLLITGQVHLALNQPKRALAIFEKVLTSQPNSVRVHRSLAALYLQQKQPKKAQQHLAKAIELGVQDPQYFAQLAYLNLTLGAPWSAISGYQQALFLQPQQQQYKRGLLYALQQAGNHQAALNLVDELLNNHPNDSELWLQRGAIALSVDDHLKALSSMEMALRFGEKAPTNLLSTAQLHLSSGSVKRAADLLIKYGATKIGQFSDIEPIISWMINDGGTKQALRVLNSIKDIKQLSQQAQSLFYATLGDALIDTQIKKAIAHYQRSIKLNPNQANVLISLGQYYQQQQQLSRAAIYYQRAHVFTTTKKQALAGLAQVALDQQHYNKALKYLEQLKPISHNPHRVEKNMAIIKRLISQQS